jgi:hypothetical protein
MNNLRRIRSPQPGDTSRETEKLNRCRIHVSGPMQQLLLQNPSIHFKEHLRLQHAVPILLAMHNEDWVPCEG